MLFAPEHLQGIELLGAAVAIWVSNVVVFALLYWLIDRGGPEERSARTFQYGDFLFPERSGENSAPPEWNPTFVDYLFLAFTGATGFGLTHSVPVSRRGKLLMMTEATISLIALVIVGARAVAIVQ